MMEFKTGDICPVSGMWKLVENNGEEVFAKKGDVFSTYNMQRAHFKLIREIEQEEDREVQLPG